VKLLLDENLSSRLLELLAADFADSTHVERLGMRGATDAAIWAYAREHGYTIVSKDSDRPPMKAKLREQTTLRQGGFRV